MRRSLVVVASVAIVAAFTAAPTRAAQPNNQACLGKDFSSYARFGTPEGSYLDNDPGAGFGQFNAALAQSVPGLGLPVQIHMAGGIPDWYVANTCNNP